MIVNPGGPIKVRIISSYVNNFCAVLVNIPLLSTKKAAIISPDGLAEIKKSSPDFIFSKTNETKQINGFNCKKFFATNKKNNTNYEVWITPDVSLPLNGIKLYAELGGFPIQCISMTLGKPFITTVKSISEEKVPAGTFEIPRDYEIINYEDIRGMSSSY